MRKHYPIEINQNIKDKVYYPSDFNIQTPLSEITFGNRSVPAQIEPHPKGKNIIILSQNIADELTFPNLKVPLHLFTENQTLYIGPLIGIFTCGFTTFPMRPIGDRTLFFSKLLSVKKTVGALPFLFGEQHINWDKGTVNGLFYHEHGWKFLEVPFPNVIYDRLPNRRAEKLIELKKVKDRLQHDYLIPWYNPGFFNKLDIYERLIQVDDIAHYLPETHIFSSFSLIERMLSDYGHIYLKPMNGSLGLGIHQIIYDRNEDTYYCRYQDESGTNRLRKYETLEALMGHVFAHRKLETMIVQQGIHLIRVNQRPVDFRIHTNKDDLGNWVITAMAAKVAGPGSVTTHINNGGIIKTVEEVFPENDQKELIAHLKKAALQLSAVLENQIEGIIGEIGFDMGIDNKGHVWLFEANSKPGRSIFKHPGLKEFDLLTRQLSLSFGVFLTERAITMPEVVFP